MRDAEKRRAVFNKMKEIDSLLIGYGLSKSPRLKRQVKVNRCMADSKRSLVIFPTGKIGKCQHYSESHFIGHIDSDHWDMAIVERFKECREIEDCHKCFRFPECFWLEMCEDQPHCYPEEREYEYLKIQEGMLKSYNQYKEKIIEETEEDDDEIQN